MKLLLSRDFPQSPPKGMCVILVTNCVITECIDFSFRLTKICFLGYFLTKIFHPNIASNGEICVNTLKKDWNPTLGLRHVLHVSCWMYITVHGVGIRQITFCLVINVDLTVSPSHTQRKKIYRSKLDFHRSSVELFLEIWQLVGLLIGISSTFKRS